MKFSIKLFVGLLIMSMVAVSCDDFLDINENPNNPRSAPIDGLMTRVTLESARNTNRVAATTSFFVQHFASPVSGGGSDTHQDVSYGVWANLYFVLGDIAEMNNLAQELNAPHYEGVGLVLKAYNWSLLVNMFGDVPFRDALFGQALNPSYDSSEFIYEQILDMLATAIQRLNAAESTVSPGADDFIFGGNRDAWIRTAYALRARHLNHFSKLPSYDRAAVLAAVDNAFQNNSQDFQMAFFNEGTQTRNPWYNLALSNAGLLLGGWLSDQFVNHMNGTLYNGIVDPRITRITAAATNPNFPQYLGQFIGTRNGEGRGDAPEAGVRAVLRVGSWYASAPNAPLLMSTYVEMKFIEAEAALTTNPARAFQAYEAGIRAHMQKLGVPQNEIDDYWANPEVSDQAAFGIDRIMKEKYIAMFLMPEAWNDARRYNYAYHGFQLPANHNPDLGGQFLRRVRYPDSEIQRNREKMPTRTLLDRLFWDAP